MKREMCAFHIIYLMPSKVYTAVQKDMLPKRLAGYV